MRLTLPEIGVAAGREVLVEFGRGKGDRELHFGHVEFETSIRHSSGRVKWQLSRIWSMEEKSGLQRPTWGLLACI